MEKRKTHSKTSFLKAGIVLVSMGIVLFTTAFSATNQPQLDDDMSIQFFTVNGRVDLETGISKSTDKLFVRMLPAKSGSLMGYRISKIKTTLVSGGRGQWSIDAKEMVNFGNGLDDAESGSILLVEVLEYMTKDENDIVEKIALDKPYFFRIPVN